MQRDEVEKHLRNYRYAVGRSEYLSAEISHLSAEINEALNHIAEDSASISAQVISDMPHGTTVGNPTERTALRLVEGYVPDYIVNMRDQMHTYETDYKRLALNVLFVDAWLRGLNDREAWIIKAYYVDAETWELITAKYAEQFGLDAARTSKTLKRLRASAFEKVCRMAE